MLSYAELADDTKSHVTGIRWHEPSRQFVAQIGYHEIKEVRADGTSQTRRVRTTHYLGGTDDRDASVSKFRSIKTQWNERVSEQRRDYDIEQDRRRREKLPLLSRFKPLWPKTVVRTAKP